MSESRQQVQQPAGPIPHEVFWRMRWSVLDAPSEVQICEPNDQGTVKWRPLFDDSNAAIFDGPAVDPPESRLDIVIEPLQSWWHWHDAEIDHLRPEKAVIENLDGRHISVKQFIRAVHDYAVPLRKLLLRCMDIIHASEWSTARFYFHVITGGSEGETPGTLQLDVNLVEDPSGNGDKCSWVWEDAEGRVKKQSGLQ